MSNKQRISIRSDSQSRVSYCWGGAGRRRPITTKGCDVLREFFEGVKNDEGKTFKEALIDLGYDLESLKFIIESKS